jgi:hypothetical protein
VLTSDLRTACLPCSCGDWLLLGRKAAWTPARYSCLAGKSPFVAVSIAWWYCLHVPAIVAPEAPLLLLARLLGSPCLPLFVLLCQPTLILPTNRVLFSRSYLPQALPRWGRPWSRRWGGR